MSFHSQRREFLKFMTSQSALLSLSPLLGSEFLLTACTSQPKRISFKPLQPSFEDKLLLAEGLSFQVLCQQGEIINPVGEAFGSNNDFTAFLPLNQIADEGLLWVNHESVVPEFVHQKNTKQLTRSKNEVIKEQEQVGGSILHIKKIQNQWMVQKNSDFNRRFHGRTPIPFSHGSQIQGSGSAMGTIANCAGGKTPWNTFLTSEENYDEFYGDVRWVNGKREFVAVNKLNWYKHFPLPPEHYGWVVEINPLTGEAVKQVLLGRASHEGATVVKTNDSRVVVYMGEDRPGGFIYKFISTGMHLKEGTLYAADTINGRWLALDLKKNPKLQKAFKSQLDVLTYSHYAAALVGATPQDRPEDIEVDQKTGEVYIALTKNPDTKNLYGSLFKITEKKGNDSLEFESKHWVSGGPQAGLACPDNLCFDNKGNLWVTVDMSENEIGKPAYKSFGNNGLFYIPLRGELAGIPVQVASAPVDAELTGPSFSPDFKTLFLSVQHPGAQSRKDLAKLTSHWPNGKSSFPRSAVVSIQGELLNQLTQS